MNELEKLAKAAFERYSLTTTGKEAYWAYLATERKIAWMKEVIFLLDFLGDEIKSRVKPLPTNLPQAAFAQGYQAGISEERAATIGLVEFVKQGLKVQLEQFKQQQEYLGQQE